MARVQQFLDIDVLTAARQRIEHIYDIFDSVVLSLSGGKDSSACLYILKEFHEKHDLGPVNCIFYDEETIPFSSIRVMEWFREQPWVNLHWQCFHHRDNRLILGEFREHIRWDPNREWTRPMPEWAETIEDYGLPAGTIVGDDIKHDDINATLFKGKIAQITGIRAAESLVRYRSVVNKLNENYINTIDQNPSSRIKLCKPIYDWLENDVLKWLMDNDAPLAESYAAQTLTGATLRIGPPLGATSKKFGALREQDPELYEAALRVFPDMAIPARYYDDFDQEAFVQSYAKDGFSGVMRYIYEHVADGAHKDKLIYRVRKYKAMHKLRPDEFPVDHLLRETIKGTYTPKVRGIDKFAKKNQRKR